MCAMLTNVVLAMNVYHIPTGIMLKENTTLTSLGLESCKVGSDGLWEVCSALGVNTTLTSLDLSGNMFDDKTICCLGKL